MLDIPLLLDSSLYFISYTIGPTDLLHPSRAPNFKTFHGFLIYFPNCQVFSTIQSYVPKFAGKNGIFLVECCFCQGNPGFNSTCTSYIICYHVTEIVSIFHIIQLCFACRNLHCGRLPWDSYCISFVRVDSHPTASSSINWTISHGLQQFSSSASSTRPSAYLAVRLLILPFWSLRNLAYFYWFII